MTYEDFDINSEAQKGTITSNLLGFFLSLGLTLVAYYLVVSQSFTPLTLLASISGLAIVQLIVQLIFFLHLNQESSPRWNLLAFIFMFLVIFLLVGGSLWIMYHLNDRVMPTMMHNLHHQ